MVSPVKIRINKTAKTGEQKKDFSVLDRPKPQRYENVQILQKC